MSTFINFAYTCGYHLMASFRGLTSANTEQSEREIMSSNEFEVVTALEKVRAMKSLIEQLDPMVPALIPDAEHASIRRTLRKWEADLQAKVSIRNRAAKEVVDVSNHLGGDVQIEPKAGS